MAKPKKSIAETASKRGGLLPPKQKVVYPRPFLVSSYGDIQFEPIGALAPVGPGSDF
jgi:hypothetical protein